MTKRNRSTLKEFFQKGKIPTESNFADLIDSTLSQEDDNVFKLPNDPLSIRATGPDEGLINFYRVEEGEDKLTWQLKQKTGDKPGLSISDSGGTSRLFIESGTGNVGIGTTDPKYKLDVKGHALFTGDYLYVNSESAGRLRVGAAWGMPGLYSGDDGAKDLILGVTHNQKVYLGMQTEDAYVEGGTGNAYFKGNVGIGTTSPTQAKLVVEGHMETEVKGYGFLNRNGAGATNTTYTINYSIWCSQRVAASEFNALSDGRIKNVVGVSDRSQDLETLTKLQITDYTFIDVVNKGPGSHKKLIAQQVQRVYPMAVNVTQDFIPNVYEMSASTRHDSERGRMAIATEKIHGLVVGDTVRIIDDTGPQELEVLSVPDWHTFTVAGDRALSTEGAAEEVFVYGKRVDDFLVLDYEAIAMLNVSATQELAMRVDAQHSRIAKLESEIALLKAAKGGDVKEAVSI